MLSRPDVLVLGGGGVLGEAWMMGMLAGVEDASGFDLRDCEHLVGTSAGAIVAAHLVAGKSPRRPGHVPDPDPEEPGSRKPAEGLAAAAGSAARRMGALAWSAAGAFAPLALGAAVPGGTVVRAAMLRRLPQPAQRLNELRRQVEDSGARFDGRLRVAAVERRSGRRVVFGSPSAPQATVAEAVAASCTVPWLFAPVEISGHEYVDGGIWSPTNLDAAPAGRGTYVLCLVPTASIAGSHRLIALLRSVSRAAVSVEALALRRRGADVRSVAPSRASAEAMGSDWMNREPHERVLAAGYRQGLAFAAAAGTTAR
ncbi:MAG: patatin-like phospholipase family protein [Actinomycetota bacterium]|nr:patatin-like phospholipase family protein [Actinomycetota bacterium]